MNNLYSDYNTNYYTFKNNNSDKNGLVSNITSNYNYNLYNSDNIMTSPINLNKTEILAIEGNYEATPILITYFSDNNIKTLQNSIRYYIYKKTNSIIDNQSTDELYIIMRSIMFQQGDLSLTSHNSIYYEIQKINKIVIDYCVNKIISEISMYNKYENDMESLLVPLDNPEYMGVDKQLGNPYFN